MFFDSRRSPVLSRNGMVATSQPLAALAGVSMPVSYTHLTLPTKRIV